MIFLALGQIKQEKMLWGLDRLTKSGKPFYEDHSPHRLYFSSCTRQESHK